MHRKNRRVIVQQSNTFKDLQFALYFGSRPVASQLLFATTSAPLAQPNASAEVPFGDSSLLLEFSRRPDGTLDVTMADRLGLEQR